MHGNWHFVQMPQFIYKDNFSWPPSLNLVNISFNITIHPLEMIMYLIKLLCIVIFRNYLLNLEMAPKTAHKTLHTLKLVGYYIPFVFIAWEANLLHIAKSNSHFIDYYLFINKVCILFSKCNTCGIWVLMTRIAC